MNKPEENTRKSPRRSHTEARGNGGSPLLHRFAAMAEEHAKNPACLRGDSALTYQELDRASSRLAASIAELSGPKPAPVALFLDRTCEVLIGCMAAAKAGVPYVPINMAWPEGRIAHVLTRVGARVALTAPELPVPARLLAAKSVLPVDARAEAARPAGPAWAPSPKTTSDTPLYILFTSGSTGEPKGVVVTHGNVAQFATAPECPGFGPGRRVTSCCATAFDLSVAETWGSMLNGCTLACAPPGTFLDSRRCLDFMHHRRLDYAVLPTAVFNALAAQDAGMFGALEKLILCGELPNSALCRRVLDTAPPKAFYNTYGPTECTVFVTVERLDAIDETAVIPAGRPLPTASIHIVDGRGRQLGPGQWGEVVIGGQGVAAGYFDDPERTAAAFIPDPAAPADTAYRTGDRGMLAPDGRLTVSGRFDDQVKISGMRVELGEIRTLLNAAPGVRLGHVVHHAENGLIAYAVMDSPLPEADEDAAREGLRQFLGGHLPPALLPRHILFVPALPLNPNGKVDAAQLPPPPLHRAAAGEKASCVLEAFRAALRDDTFHAEDSFLARGGNSLVAAALIGTLHRQTGVWVPLEYFSNPKTAQLVEMFIASARPAAPAPSRQHSREQVRF